MSPPKKISYVQKVPGWVAAVDRNSSAESRVTSFRTLPPFDIIWICFRSEFSRQPMHRRGFLHELACQLPRWYGSHQNLVMLPSLVSHTPPPIQHQWNERYQHSCVDVNNLRFRRPILSKDPSPNHPLNFPAMWSRTMSLSSSQNNRNLNNRLNLLYHESLFCINNRIRCLQ